MRNAILGTRFPTEGNPLAVLAEYQPPEEKDFSLFYSREW